MPEEKVTKEARNVKIEQTAGAVLFRRRGDKVLYLLLQRPRGNWVFPGGKIEKGEAIIDTIRREIKEETGISRIRFLSGYRETVRFRYKWPPKTKGAEDHLKFVALRLAQVFGGHVEISEEHKNFQWVPFEKAQKMLKHRNIRLVLERAHSYIYRSKKDAGKYQHHKQLRQHV